MEITFLVPHARVHPSWTNRVDLNYWIKVDCLLGRVYGHKNGKSVVSVIILTRCPLFTDYEHLSWFKKSTERFQCAHITRSTTINVDSFKAISMNILISNLHETIWNRIDKYIYGNGSMIKTMRSVSSLGLKCMISICVASIACLSKWFWIFGALNIDANRPTDLKFNLKKQFSCPFGADRISFDYVKGVDIILLSK